MPPYYSYLSTLLLELHFYLLICLPTYAPTFLPTYVFYIAKYLTNYLLTFPTPHKPPNPTYQFIKVCPSLWMMNIGAHM
jgi:hypothetical protein